MRFVRLDVTDADSVRAAAEHVGRETEALDVLVNNAAVLLADDGFPGKVSFETIERTFDANFYGPLRVTQAFLPLVRRTEAGRIVHVSSTMGSLSNVTDPNSFLAPLIPQYPNFAYAASKTALGALTAWLSIELAGTSIKGQ